MQTKLNKYNLWFLASLCGFSVANIYYNQTLLRLMAIDFNIDIHRTSLLLTLTQMGYAFGLLLIVPLGDIVNRRRIIILLLIVNALVNFFSAMSISIEWLFILSFFIGLTSISAQIVIPAITTISEEKERGSNVGLLMTGLFSGIIFARTLSGLMGEHYGWRYVYIMSAIIDLFLIGGAIIFSPQYPKGKPLSYTKTIMSLFFILRDAPSLRRSCVLGSLIFAAFCSAWGSITILLSSSPYHYTSGVIGTFSLIGIFGTLASSYIGKLADKKSPEFILFISSPFMLLAFFIFGISGFSIILCILALAIMDLSSRASFLSNQLVNYKLPVEIRSRVNTIFMFFYFAGGALGSYIGAVEATNHGWIGVSYIGGLLSALAIILLMKKFVMGIILKN